MSDGAIVAAIGKLIAGLIAALGSRTAREADHAEKTLVAILSAADATEDYEAWRGENGGRRDTGREREVAHLWREAAVYVTSHDSDLARRLEAKGDYWMRPTEWNDQEIASARIGLGEVTKDAKRRLKIKLKR